MLQVRRGQQPLKLKVKLEEPPAQEPVGPAVAAVGSSPRKPGQLAAREGADGARIDPSSRWLRPLDEPEIEPGALPSP